MRLKYELQVIGYQNVERALAAVERRFIESNRRMGRAAGVSPGQPRATSPRAGVMSQARLEAGVQRFQHKQALRNIAAENKAKIAGERAAAKEAAGAQRQRIRDERTAQREQLRQARVAHRQAMDTRRTRERFARATLGTVGDSVSRTTRTIAGGATAALGLGGGMLVADSLQKTARAEKQAMVLANQAVGGEGDTRSRTEIQKSILNQTRAEGLRTGLGQEGAISALHQFYGISGRMQEGQALLPFMGDLADAYGADIGDVGRTGGQIAQALATRGITGDESVRQTQNILASMASQAKIGSIEFADLAKVMGELISSTARFTGDVDELASTMGAVAQLAIAGAASSPEEAMTAILRISDDVIKNSHKFEKQGIDVFTNKSKTELKAPEEIIFEALKKTGGSLPKMTDLFDIRSSKAVGAFQKVYTEAGGGEAGLKKVRELLDKAKGNMDTTEIRESAQAVRETSAKKFDIAVVQLETAVGERLLPAFVRLIPEFEKLIPHAEKAAGVFAKFVEEFAKNPIGTIGKVIAAKVAIDVAGAGIGAAVRAAIVAAIAGGGTPLPPGTPPVVAGGPGGNKRPGVVGGGGMVAGTLGVLGLGLALDQANKLGKELGAETSINPFANSKGQVSNDNFLGTLLDTLTFGLTGDEGLQERGGKVAAEVYGKLTKEEKSATIHAGKDYDDRYTPETRANFAKAREDQAVIESLKGLSLAATEATSELKKLKGETPNRGNKPSPSGA